MNRAWSTWWWGIRQTRVACSPIRFATAFTSICLTSREDQGLQKQPEPAAPPDPRHTHPLHPVLWALHSGQASVQKRLALEEVQVTPRRLRHVVRRTVSSAALRALEPVPSLEVHMDVEPPVLGTELRFPYHPGPLKPQRLVKQIGVPHIPSSRPSPSTPSIPLPGEGHQGGRPSCGRRGLTRSPPTDSSSFQSRPGVACSAQHAHGSRIQHTEEPKECAPSGRDPERAH